MTCQQVQTNLSLFLYGDLDFATEEQLEEHLSWCAACQLALDREKAWHATLNVECADVPLDLLARCRRELKVAVKSPAKPRSSNLPWKNWAAAFWFFHKPLVRKIGVCFFLPISRVYPLPLGRPASFIRSWFCLRCSQSDELALSPRSGFVTFAISVITKSRFLLTRLSSGR